MSGSERRALLKNPLALFGPFITGLNEGIQGEALNNPRAALIPREVISWLKQDEIKKAELTQSVAFTIALPKIIDTILHTRVTRRQFIYGCGALATLFGLSACFPKATPSAESTSTPIPQPSPTERATVTAQVTALPTELNPVMNATPSALEVIPTNEPKPGHSSVIAGLNEGEVTPGNTIGMVIGYESTGINTLYNSADAPTPIIMQSGETVNAIRPRGYGIDQDQIATLFGATGTSESGYSDGSYNGTPVTWKNGIWSTSTGEVCIPFSKTHPNAKAESLVMTTTGKFQKVNVVNGTKIGEEFSMFQTPTDVATRLKNELQQEDPTSTAFQKIEPAQVVGVEMNKNGSLNFIQLESRALGADPGVVKPVKVVHEVSYLGEAEDLSKNADILTLAATYLSSVGSKKTVEDLFHEASIQRIEGLTKKGEVASYNILTTFDGQKNIALSIKEKNGDWSKKPEDPLRLLSEIEKLSFGLGLDPGQGDAPRDDRYGSFDAALIEIGDFEYSFRDGIDMGINPKAINAMNDCVKVLKKKNLTGQALSPDTTDLVKGKFYGLDEKKSIQVIGEYVETFTKMYPSFIEWIGVNEGTWLNLEGDVGLRNGPWFTSMEYKSQGVDYIPDYMKVVYDAMKRGNSNLVRLYSDSQILEEDTNKNERVFGLVKALHDQGYVDKMAFHGHMRFGKNTPPPQTEEELTSFKKSLKARMKRYIDAGIPIGIYELDVIFLNDSPVKTDDRSHIAGPILGATLKAYLETIDEAALSTSISEEEKQKITDLATLIVFGPDNTTSWATNTTHEGVGYLMYDNAKPQPALYDMNAAILDHVSEKR